ncbi:hypothetical protein KKF34_04075 [Myxococcota bacterium]|nr:hypothetical protein [Myxococcota bacterium]MBU1381122.1 hypothetical protein [Myxococcota bacterium]MBU1496034.1 hypothetical protein [Myxococcota bacterium]
MNNFSIKFLFFICLNTFSCSDHYVFSNSENNNNIQNNSNNIQYRCITPDIFRFENGQCFGSETDECVLVSDIINTNIHDDTSNPFCTCKEIPDGILFMHAENVIIQDPEGWTTCEYSYGDCQRSTEQCVKSPDFYGVTWKCADSVKAYLAVWDDTMTECTATSTAIDTCLIVNSVPSDDGFIQFCKHTDEGTVVAIVPEPVTFYYANGWDKCSKSWNFSTEPCENCCTEPLENCCTISE